MYCWAKQIWIVKLNLKMKKCSPFLECLNYLCTEKSVNWLDLSFFCSLYVFRLWNGCLIAAHFRTGRPSAGLRGLFSTMAGITGFFRKIMRYFFWQQKYYSWCIKKFPKYNTVSFSTQKITFIRVLSLITLKGASIQDVGQFFMIFDPYPPTVGSFLLLSVGKFGKFLTPPP